MSRRIDIELTSTRPEGTWTWRAAGAKQPKGEIESSMLPAGSKVGDVLRVDIEKYLDGISVVAVLPSTRARTEPERIEVVGTRRNEELVTSTLVEKRGRRDGDRGDRGPRGDRPGGDRGPRGDRPGGPGGRPGGPGGRPGAPGGRPGGDRGPRSDRPAGDRGPRSDRPAGDRGPRSGAPRTDRPAGDRPPRRDRPAPPPAPKAARLRPGRTHRNAVLAELPEAQKPIAEQLLRGGIPAVRQAIDKQNEVAKAEGQQEIKADALVAFAEQLLPRLRAAEWRDKADAALAGIDEIDLRDLRTVVVAADAAGRDEETRALAQQLRDGLTARVDGEHGKWLSELTELVTEGRTVRALRLSSRPPKAGAPLPQDLADRLAESASAGLTAEITQDRWGTLVDAIAFSPVRLAVRPLGIPATVGDELKATIVRIASRVPQIAELFGVAPTEPAARRAPGTRARRPGGVIPPKPPRPAATEAAAAAAPDAASPEAPVSETPVSETPVPDAASTETPEASSETVEAAVVADATAPQAEPVDASGDGAQEPVVVQELGESVDEA